MAGWLCGDAVTLVPSVFHIRHTICTALAQPHHRGQHTACRCPRQVHLPPGCPPPRSGKPAAGTGSLLCSWPWNCQVFAWTLASSGAWSSILSQPRGITGGSLCRNFCPSKPSFWIGLKMTHGWPHVLHRKFSS